MASEAGRLPKAPWRPRLASAVVRTRPPHHNGRLTPGKRDYTPVRAGEEIDADALARHLRGKLAGVADGLRIHQFPAGHSNLTYLIECGGREWVLRRPPLGPVAPRAHDMAREYGVLRRVHPLFPAAPEALLVCEDASVIGAPFFLMERRRGLTLRRSVPVEYAGEQEFGERVSRGFVRCLAALHAVPVKGLDIGRSEGFLARQVQGWAGRWRRAQTEALPKMDAVIEWLEARIPASGEPTLVHNDFKLDNLMLDPGDPGTVTAVLDWEMATVGDPLADLGCALCYWPQADDPPSRRDVLDPITAHPGWWRRERLVAEYAAATGRDVSAIGYYEVFGLFKLAVILQQIYFRYREGQTRDERFRDFDARVRGLVESAAASMENLPVERKI
jgi:aminoglycoside phosphotransferase (APT) family kinase protein